MTKIMVKNSGPRSSAQTKPVRTAIGRIIVGKKIREFFLGMEREKVLHRECLFVHRKQGLFLSVYVNDMKTAEKKQNMTRMWTKLLKGVDLDELASFFDHLYLGCTQRECEPNERMVEKYKKACSCRVILLEQRTYYQDGSNITQKQQHGPTT